MNVPPSNTGFLLLKHAVSLHQQGDLANALDLYRQAIAIDPNNFDAYQNMGILYAQIGRWEESLHAFIGASTIRPRDFSVHYNRGKVFQVMHRYQEALASYDRSLSLNPSYADAYNNRGIVLYDLRRYDESLDSLRRAILLNPKFADAYVNQGNVLRALRRHNDALNSYNTAIFLNSNSAEAYNNRAIVLNALWRHDEALADCDKAIALNPLYAMAFYNRGNILNDLKRHEEALANYDRAISLDPDHPHAYGDRLFTQLHLCEWDGFEERVNQIIRRLDQGVSAIPPFLLLATPVTAKVLKKSAELFAADKYPPAQRTLWHGERYSHDKIRIGYFSADFHNHATAYLMAELFEKHDRSRFASYAYSFGPSSQDAMRQRLVNAFDHFIDVADQSNQDIAALARQHEIDIAVDLKGFTQDCRPGVFALRPAPIQVNYLGFPGTMGVCYMDYIIADPVLIPEAHFEYYSEKVVHLPPSYQVNDSRRPIAEVTPGRRELGLPQTGFVFCCFNNNYKITPDVFTIWMQLLSEVDDSVLWLLEGNPSACQNLRREAEARGVAPDRLVFAPRVELADHLARHRQADLFLDTFYCNAHTTTSDALWAGLPVLTCLGNTFASRVAASLLTAIGLPELITRSHEDYHALALQLATQPHLLATLRQRLAQHRLTQPLFDAQLFTRHIESAYTEMWRRHQQGLTPEHFLIER